MKRIIAVILTVITLSTCLIFGGNTNTTAAEMTDEQKIWFFFKDAGLSDYGVAGLMGNLFAESGLRANNLQNSFESRLGYSDTSYTAAVDNGTYTRDKFGTDGAGYGLAQWTFHTRKKGLYDFAQEEGTSIGDLTMQLKYLELELTLSFYPTVWVVLMEATDIATASDVVLHKFEAPADQSASVEQLRRSYGMVYYNKYAGTTKPETESSAPSEDDSTTSTESPEVTYGDVNGDGSVTPLDASLVLQYNAKLIKTLEVVDAADVNADGSVTPLDASLILQYNAKLIKEFPR